MNEFPMVDVLRLRPLEGYRLWLRFTDGVKAFVTYPMSLPRAA